MLETINEPPSNWMLLSVSQVKANKRVTITREDDQIYNWIRVATGFLENEYQISICPRTMRLTLPRFPCEVHLPYPPLRYVATSEPESAIVIKYKDVSGAEQTLPPTAYRAFKSEMTWRIVASDTWPETKADPRAVKVEYDIGYADPMAVPASIRQSAMLLASYYIQHRDATFEEPKISMIDRSLAFGIPALMKPYRVTARYSA